MASVLALVAKGAFEKEHAGASVGTTLPFTHYASANRALETLAEGGDLYLVTVRPGEQLWLVAVLRAPRFARDAWRAAENVVPVTDGRRLLEQLRFASGKGISVEPGKLAMSLQTPRALTEEDVRKIEALLGAKAAPVPPTKTAVKTTATPEKAATQAVATETGTARPASVPATATFDVIDRRWIDGTRGPDGARMGAWREWREDGSLYMTTHYVGGLVHGQQDEFHPDGSLAMTAKWVMGIQKDTVAHRCQSGETDFEMWKDIDPRIVRVVSVPDEDGLGWRSGVLYDASGTVVSPKGEPVPARPAGVPETARFFQGAGDEPSWWVDGPTQYSTHQKIGRHRYWSPAGVLLQEEEYTSWGRKIWQRASLDPDPQAALVEAFFADPITFSPGYQLGQHWTPEVHEVVRARLREASTLHVAAYLEVLGERVEWHLAERTTRGLTACGLDIVDDWLGRRAKADEGSAKIYAWALARRVDLFDRTSVRDLLASSRALLEKDESDHQELLDEATALAEGKTERELDTIAKRIASSRESATAEDVLRLARRALRVPALRVWLGDPANGEVLLLDELGRSYLFDGKSFVAAPLEIDTSERRNTKYFQTFDTCDERLLLLSGQHVWWTFTRYGWTVHVQGSQYFSSRGQGESILDGLIRCPDAAWVDRVRAMFRASAPAGATEVGPFTHEKKGFLFAWAYDASIHHPFGHELSRGVDGKTLMNTTRQPGVLRLEMLEKKKDAKPKPAMECASEAEAIERFNRFEMKLLRNGYRHDRVVALPVRTPVKEERPKVAKPVPAALSRAVAPSVAAELRRALEAKDLGDAIDALREAWVKRPATALADALDTLSERTPPMAELGGKTKPALAAWDAAEKKRDPASFGRLLATLTDVPSTIVQPRIERLVTWPTDPRLDRALIEIAWNVPFTSSGTQSVWRRIFARLKTSEDARILERLRDLPKRYKKEWKTVTGAWAREVVEKIAEERGPTLEALGALTLDAGDTALLAKIVAKKERGPTSGAESRGKDELLARILAAPDDAALRLAYAEAAGPKDIRAEHIRLSSRRDTLDRTGRARLAEIERDHTAELAGPLAKWIKKGARFDRGFLVQAECRFEPPVTEEIAASPWWSTLEDIHVGWDRLLMCSPALVSAHTLRGVMFATPKDKRGGELDDAPVRPRVTTLSLAVHDLAGLRELLRSKKFPALTDLTIHLDRMAQPHLAWLEEPGADRLTRIGIVQDVNGGSTIDRTSVSWLVELWKRAPTALPKWQSIEGEITYNAATSFRIDRIDGARSELFVRSQMKHWLNVLTDNVCALLEEIGPLGCQRAHLDIKHANEALQNAVEESAKLGKVEVVWGKAKA